MSRRLQELLDAVRSARTPRQQALACHRLGAFHDRNNREAQAIPHYRRALRLGLPRETEARTRAWLASSLHKTGAPTAALRELRRALALTNNLALQKFLRGLARRVEKSSRTPAATKPRPAPPRAWSASIRRPHLVFTRAKLAHCLRLLEAQPGPHPPAGELSLAFLTDGDLARLHADFLRDPAPTDVITFPGDAAAGLAGEICVSVDRAAEVARRRGVTLARELTLYLVHGWLHLAGLDDRTVPGRRAMRRRERRLLAALERHGALPDFRLSR